MHIRSSTHPPDNSQNNPKVIDKEGFANVMNVLSSVMDMAMVALFAIVFDAPLTILGLIMVIDSCLFLCLNVIISIQMGWIAKFEHGLFGKFALRNKEVFKDLFRTALVSVRDFGRCEPFQSFDGLIFQNFDRSLRGARQTGSSPLRLGAFWATPSGKS